MATVRPFLLRRGTSTAPTGGSFKRRSLKLRRGTKESREIETDCKCSYPKMIFFNAGFANLSIIFQYEERILFNRNEKYLQFRIEVIHLNQVLLVVEKNLQAF